MAVIGLYRVISYSVTQRTQEIGIRMALGAQRREVLGMVIGHGMQLVGIGAAIGLVASLAFGRVLKNQLFQVSAFDPPNSQLKDGPVSLTSYLRRTARAST
jgi:putative ABC transport system permease protein